MRKHNKATSPQQRVSQARALLPASVQPGQGSLDLSGLRQDIQNLERQKVVSAITHWIEANASWLCDVGMTLPLLKLRLRMCHWNTTSLELNWVLEDFPTLPKDRLGEVSSLIEELTSDLADDLQEFVDAAVDDLNLIRWHPQPAVEVLCKCVRDHVRSPEQWVNGHIAWAKASRLKNATALAPAKKMPRRL
jgi:hypothetical protein